MATSTNNVSENRNETLEHKFSGQIINWLSKNQVKEGYDQGGIWDPLDERVMGDHYSTTHFAWAAALLAAHTESEDYLPACKQAIDFHIKTSPEEYPPGNWSYHWDFNNLAFISTYSIIKNTLTSNEKTKWETAIKTWQTNTHDATNWLAMRAVAHNARFNLFGTNNDQHIANTFVERVLATQDNDGCFDDIKGMSKPSQYHAYTACLLHMLLNDYPKIQRYLVSAARWLLKIILPDGDMTYLGRGQGQIFGYVCGLYLFKAAYSFDKTYSRQYLWATQTILTKLSEAFTKKGYFPLVINDLPVVAKAGWYDYHHLSVYNSFAAVWLLMAEKLDLSETVDPCPPENNTIFLSESGILRLHSKEVNVVFSTGLINSDYAVDCAITPQYLKVGGEVLFKYPQGPGPGKYGAKDKHLNQEKNCWAPLAKYPCKKNWIAPFNGKGSIQRINDTFRATFRNKGIEWHRHIGIGQNYLHLQDSACSLSGEKLLFRATNLALHTGLAKRAGKNTLLTKSGNIIRVHTDLSQPLAGEEITTAANGKLDIFSSESILCSSTASVTRLRRGPVNTGGDLPNAIVCLSWDPWSTLWKRKQRLLFELAPLNQKTQILYFEPAVTLTEIAENCSQLIKNDLKGSRYRRALHGRADQKQNNFYLFSQLSPIPWQRSYKMIEDLNLAFLSRRINSTIKKKKINSFILWIYHPSQIHVLDELGSNAELIIYDWTDDWVEAYPDHLPTKGRSKLEVQQDQLLQKVDVVFTVSRALYQRAKKYTPWTYLIPNATDTEIFTKAYPLEKNILSEYGVPRGKVTLGYLSQITNRVDFKLVETIAINRPDWFFLMIGPIVCEDKYLETLYQLENILFLGAVEYQKAAKLIASCDVCILPHRKDALTHTLDPIKLYDYLATGRPIVSTDVAMHDDLGVLISKADDALEFEKAIVSSLNADEEAEETRLTMAAKHTWQKRVTKVNEILRSYF